MALVTLQRSPVDEGSPQCSNSDGEADDDEGIKNDKSECFFAGKGTALVLALKDVPPNAERRLSTDSTRSTNSTQSNNSDIQQHLQSMFYLLRHEETLKMAVKLESHRPNRTRYLVIASRCCYRAVAATTNDRRSSRIMRHNSAKTATAGVVMGGAGGGAPLPAAASHAVSLHARQLSVDSGSTRAHQQQQLQLQQQLAADAEQRSDSEAAEKRLSAPACASKALSQSVKCDADKNTASGDSKCADVDPLGIEESCLLGIDCNERTTIGLVVPILADTTIHLDGDGGFSVSVYGKTHIFKPVSVQAMWSALQTLHKVSQKARENNFYPGGPSHDWLAHYERRIESDQSCLNEWNAMDALESRRPPSPDAIRNKPTAKEETESVIKMKLKEIMMSVDLDEVTSKYIRGRLEEHLDMDLGEYKSFIDEEMLIILGQMDAPTEIFEHVYLGSEWNASNLEELQKNGVRHILNVTREIDNFFPGMFDYFNVRVYDDEKTNLLKHWDNTFRYITRAKAEGSKVLVHCKMGVSRSASVVIAYAMKAYNWEFQRALQHVKERRNCIKPNKNFLSQLETYRGMLDAMKNKEKLQRSKSETNLKSTKDARLLPGSEPTPLIQALNQSKSKSAGHGSMMNDVGAAAGGVGASVSPEVGRGVGKRCSREDVDGGGGRNAVVTVGVGRIGGGGVGSVGSDALKQRRLMRRSSSTSPKSIQGHAANVVVVKQQSQSLENLTPERSVADEPKNVRFPGSNGENYSVTQNQVLHIQKNMPPSSLKAGVATGDAPPTSSVRNIVHDLEAHQDSTGRKTADDRKTLNLPFGRSVSTQETATTCIAVDETPPRSAGKHCASGETCGSPVWTSSAMLITQTSNLDGAGAGTPTGDMFSAQLDNVFAREEEEKRRRRTKTHSWTATSGGIFMDSGALVTRIASSSNSSIDSAATTASEVLVRPRPRQRETPSRHASWGSGDTRGGPPMRNSSWGSYDTNRNTFAATSAAIVEGQIHELNTNTSNKTAAGEPAHPHHHVGTVRRTKQKLQECSSTGKALNKKLCQAEEQAEALATTTATLNATKRGTTLYRSASAAGSTRSRYPLRCNSEEIVPTDVATIAAGGLLLQRTATRRSDGSRPLHGELFSASAPESYTMSDIENKNTLPPADDDELAATAAVVLRGGAAPASEDQRISGNVQILKKNFEAKAGATTAAAGVAAATAITTVATSASSAHQMQLSATNTAGKKGHHSLPASPVAQHMDHCATTMVTAAATPSASSAFMEPVEQAAAATNKTNTTASNAASSLPSSASASASSSSASSVSEAFDRNVKGLVHKYQATTTTTAATATGPNCTTVTKTPTTTTTAAAVGSFKPRPRSYYEHPAAQQSPPPPLLTMQKSLSGRPHDYSESRPPPAPVKVHSATPMTANMLVAQQQQQHQQQHQQQRRLQQHGKTHPLTRLSLSKQSFNAAAYNTM